MTQRESYQSKQADRESVDAELADLLGAAVLAALKAWLEAAGLSIVRLQRRPSMSAPAVDGPERTEDGQ